LDLVRHPGAVAIAAIPAPGRILLVRQLRVAVGGSLVELPAGTLEPGESPRAAAGRELREETGYRARRLRKISEFYPAPGFCTELLRIYLAEDLVPAPARPDRDERIRVENVPLPDAVRMAVRGTFRDAKSIIGTLAAARILRAKNGAR